MLKLLRSNQQIFSIVIILYCIVSVFGIYITSQQSVFSTAPFRTPFFGDITGSLFVPERRMLAFTLLTLLALVLCGFYLSRINVNHLIIPNRSQFPALFFVSISSLSFSYEMFSSVLIAAFFLLFSIDRVFGAIHQKGLTYRFIDAGILISLGSLFYFNLIFFFPFLWLAQFTLRPLSLREFLYTLIGLSIPFLYIFSGYYLFDLSVLKTMGHIGEWLTLKKIVSVSWPFIAGALFYLLIMFITNIYAINKFATTKIHVRKLYQLWFYLFINTVLIYFIVPVTGIEILVLLAIPSSVLLSIYFSECRNSFFNRSILFLLIVVPIVINIFW